MLQKETLDCVAICNNNGRRAAAIIACAERKLDLIAEKPFAITRRDLASVIAAVQRNRVHAGMMLPMRFDSPYLAIKQVADSGEIGDVCQIDAQESYQLDRRSEWQKNARAYRHGTWYFSKSQLAWTAISLVLHCLHQVFAFF